MADQSEKNFKPTDKILEQIVTNRREEVVELQNSEADQIKDLEKRGQKQISDLKKALPNDLSGLLEKQEERHEEESKATESHVKEIKEELVESTPKPQFQTQIHPGIADGKLIAPSSLGWFTPYYGTLHGSDGSIYWQGYNPGNINLWDRASGHGSGLFGTGASSFTVYMDWWFTYIPRENGYYNHTIWVPFHGFYILKADDGFFTSKEAHSRIDLSARGYQYNYKASGSTNVFSMGSQNINVNDRFDGWRTMYYSDLLGADRAYLLVTTSYHVYARGGGSYAELNFSDGTANYIGVPWVYIT